VYIKEKRYINLLGDNIEKSQIKASFFSKDALASVSVNSVVYGGIFGSESSLSDIAKEVADSHLLAIALKQVLERNMLGTFSNKFSGAYLDNEMLNSICIDKRPDEAASANSLSQYGPAIHKGRLFYQSFSYIMPGLLVGVPAVKVLFGVDDVNGAVNSVTSEAAAGAGALTRIFDGYNRFSKLSTGEWAVIDMPAQQEDLEEPQNLPEFG